MASSTSACVLFLLVCFCSFMEVSGVTINVVDLGADPQGRRRSTRAFLTAWSLACRSSKSALVYAPPGKYVVGAVVFNGPCNNTATRFSINGTVVSPSSYSSITTREWIKFHGVRGLSIIGGELDGRGAALWKCKAARSDCPSGANSLAISNSMDVIIRQLTSINSKLFHVVIHACHNVLVEGLKIVAPGESPNTDGVHTRSSDFIRIVGSSIQTGDDCISMGPGTRNLLAENIFCGPGHGISIGSLANNREEPGVQNITVKRVVFKGTQNGFRIKSWGRPSNGFVRAVRFENALMDGVGYPIVIDQNYCPGNTRCPNQNSGVKISEVVFSRIRGTSSRQRAVMFDCSPSNPCSDIVLSKINLTYQGQGRATSLCRHASGAAAGYVIPPSCL